MKSRRWRASFFVVPYGAIVLVTTSVISPPAQAFHGFGAAAKSPSALHGTVLCAPSGTSDTSMRAVIRVVRRRLTRGFGDAQGQVARLGKTCIVVASDPVTRRPPVLAAIAAPGYVALTDSGHMPLRSGRRVMLSCMNLALDCPPGSLVGPSRLKAHPYPVLQIVVPGTYVQSGSARAGFDSTGQPFVAFTLSGKGSRRWCAFTSGHVGRYSAAVLDDVVITDPVIQNAICGGKTLIAGLRSAGGARRLAIFLNYGAHPVALQAAGTQ